MEHDFQLCSYSMDRTAQLLACSLFNFFVKSLYLYQACLGFMLLPRLAWSFFYNVTNPIQDSRVLITPSVPTGSLLTLLHGKIGFKLRFSGDEEPKHPDHSGSYMQLQLHPVLGALAFSFLLCLGSSVDCMQLTLDHGLSPSPRLRK